MSRDNEAFIQALAGSLAAKTFVKLTLANYKGTSANPQKISVRAIETRKGRFLQFQRCFESRETVKNYGENEAIAFVREDLVSGARSAHLFTTNNDFQLTVGKKSSRLITAKPTFVEKPTGAHDREKNYLVDPAAIYLKLLGITTEAGEIRAKHRDKWRQINKYVEILAGLIADSPLAESSDLRIVDMGSGKGYLTFAAYDYLVNVKGLEVSMTGVDTKQETIALCSDIASACGYENLSFKIATIEEFEPGNIDILIALHACDTATDDAIFNGIRSNADIIMAAPCCHKEIRRQMKPPEVMAEILRHGIMLERTAETVTDALRAMILERENYATKIFEFVPVEHTPKNNMLAAIRKPGRKTAGDIEIRIGSLMDFFGISEQRLHRLLSRSAI
ncbi:MAG: class I SAM-dependent methyltransferase [Pyrinomonadaceae bacterium]